MAAVIQDQLCPECGSLWWPVRGDTVYQCPNCGLRSRPGTYRAARRRKVETIASWIREGCDFAEIARRFGQRWPEAAERVTTHELRAMVEEARKQLGAG